MTSELEHLNNVDICRLDFCFLLCSRSLRVKFVMYMDIVPEEFGIFKLAKYQKQRICAVDGSNKNGRNHDNGACAITIKLSQGIRSLFRLESSNFIGRDEYTLKEHKEFLISLISDESGNGSLWEFQILNDSA